MIEILGELVECFIAFIERGDFAKASIAMKNAYSDLLKQDAAFFNKVPTKDLTAKLLKAYI